MTVMPPGFTVSVPSVHAPSPLSPPQPPPPSARAAAPRAPGGPVTLSVTVVLSPTASVPAAGATVTSPARLDDSVMDQSTDPSDALSVSVPPPLPSVIVAGVSVSRPRLGGELVVAAVLGDGLGAGELGFGLADGDGCPL